MKTTTIPTRWLVWIAEGLGLGHLPVAPGTWGSLGGLVIFVLLDRYLSTPLLTAVVLLLTVASVPLCDRVLPHYEGTDPGPIVIDEIVGQWIALWPAVPRTEYFGMVPALIASFLLFRFFDIAKIYPADRLEDLEGGWGVVLDDCMSGVYASLVLSFLVWVTTFAW